MKQLKRLTTIVSILLFGCLATSFAPVSNEVQGDGYVYICTGSGAKRYHSSSSCRGLNNCTHDIIKVSLSTAKDKGKTPCKICYN